MRNDDAKSLTWENVEKEEADAPKCRCTGSPYDPALAGCTVHGPKATQGAVPEISTAVLEAIELRRWEAQARRSAGRRKRVTGSNPTERQ